MDDGRNGTARSIDWGKLSPSEIAEALRGADPDAPLPERLRNPRTPYNPSALREEAADRIEQLEAERDAAHKRGMEDAAKIAEEMSATADFNIYNEIAAAIRAKMENDDEFCTKKHMGFVGVGRVCVRL